MKIKNYKCKCGHDDFFFADKGNQKGIYCSYCGKWLKWADKNEQNLDMKQAPVLDKIREEIVDLGQRTMNDNRASGIWACRDIIDKYRIERSEKE